MMLPTEYGPALPSEMVGMALPEREKEEKPPLNQNISTRTTQPSSAASSKLGKSLALRERADRPGFFDA